jgi:hypothetical protein
MFYDAVAHDISPLLTGQLVDSTDRAITLALEGEFKKPEILSLCDVMIEDADRYLRQGMSSNVWPGAKERRELADFLKSPFTLRLLERALPEILTKAEILDLDRLYEVAIQSMLLRDGRISKEGLESTLEALERFVLSGAILDHASVSAGLACGILARHDNAQIAFQHRSFAEFFLSRLIFRQLSEFNARILGRLDLIGGFNICRFLIPRLRRGFPETIAAADVPAMRWVTQQEYISFCTETGWRNGVGYGYHPYAGEEETPRFTTERDLMLERSGFDFNDSSVRAATSISWFDAFQYCRASGRKMVASGSKAWAEIELANAAPIYSWAAEWQDERRAYVAAMKRAENGAFSTVIGINPDYRAKDLGLAVA